MKFITMALAFLIKEFHDVRRQPRLMLSLVGGPLLVLGMFGATFRSANPFVSVALVWPEKGIPGITREQAASAIGSNLYLVKVTSDEAEAMRMLNAGDVEVVQIVPEVKDTAGIPHAEVRILSRTVDPNAEAWVRSVAYVEVSFMNQQILTIATRDAQDEAKGVVVSLGDAKTTLSQLQRDLDPAAIDAGVKYLRELRDTTARLSARLPEVSREQPLLAPKVNEIRAQAAKFQSNLDKLSQAVVKADVPAKIEHLNSSLADIDSLRITVTSFADTPAESIISPVQQTYTNLRGNPYSLVVFYAPAVLALLVQQLAVTLAGLGLVRERQMGAFEMFRVSPLRLGQILVGNSLAHIAFATLAGAVLTGALALLGVPLPKSPGEYAVVLGLLATAAVGVGTLVSAMSRTDSQAIQLTMLLLLLSVFFTGFFLPISGFLWPAGIISAMLPMTHAVTGFKSLLLSGTSAPNSVILGLVAITLVSFAAVLLIMRGQYRKVLS